MGYRWLMLDPMFPRLLFISLLTSLPVLADNAALEAWLNRQATFRTMEVAFVQERRLPSLKQPVSTPGKLAFAKPGRVRWQLGDPVDALVLADGAMITMVDYGEKTARRIPADSPQAARFGMLTGHGFQSVENFHEMFEVAAHRVESGIHQYTLRLKERKIRAEVPWVFLDIDPASHDLRAMELEARDGSRIRTVFQKPRLNVNLPAALFEVDLSGLTVK